MNYKNLQIIGTSHIAKQSLEEVKTAIEKDKPDIIALELDKKRIYALMNSKKDKIRLYDIRRIGIKGFVFSLIGAWAEKKLGEYVGVKPGSEMKQAVVSAKKNRIAIALVDQDIEVTLKRFSKSLTWREKWNFLVDIIKAIIFRKKEIDFDLKTVPDKKTIAKMVGKVKKRYPNIYRVLVEERNKVMGRNLRRLMDSHPDKKILAIVGAGHEEEIIRLVKKMESISYSFSVG
ncbi:TraB/GumN family protein [Candidatus Woesearchaeota archaeon]|nr:TraB/GumN family protein [Candidatus Woesearchaeota archaeon]